MLGVAMSSTHDFDDYRNTIAPHLDAMIAARQDPACEHVLGHAFLLYSFVIEDMQAKARRNQEILDNIGIMLVELQDVLRGVVHGMNVVSPVVRCNLQFILLRPNPRLFADRYRRFARVSELAHDESLPPQKRRIRPEVREDILKKCGEWISVKPNGDLHFSWNWTSEKRFKTLKQRAEALGLGSDYAGNYAAMSQFVHGTALLRNGYRGPDGNIGPIGETAQCRRFALMAAMHCMRSAVLVARFFRFPWSSREYAIWRVGWLRLAEKVEVKPA
jgi:hypothetical protein